MYLEGSTRLHTSVTVYFDEMNDFRAWSKGSRKRLISAFDHSLIPLPNSLISCLSASDKLVYHVRAVLIILTVFEKKKKRISIKSS